jgi:hypothetical protein
MLHHTTYKSKTLNSNQGKEASVLDHVDPIFFLALYICMHLNMNHVLFIPSVSFLVTLACGLCLGRCCLALQSKSDVRL